MIFVITAVIYEKWECQIGIRILYFILILIILRTILDYYYCYCHFWFYYIILCIIINNNITYSISYFRACAQRVINYRTYPSSRCWRAVHIILSSLRWLYIIIITIVKIYDDNIVLRGGTFACNNYYQ